MNFGAKGLLTPKLGACVDTVFWKTGPEKDKEKHPKKNRV
jgi:hypothetical protein